MNRLLAALIWLGLTLPALAQGYINPPVYATGTIFAVTGVTGSTSTPIKNAYSPNNLNVYNRTAMSGTWHIIMPFPAFDGQIINIGCPGGNVAVLSTETVSGSGDTIGSGGPISCTAANHTLYMYQYQGEITTWKFITVASGSGSSGGTLTITDGSATVSGVTSETVAGGCTVSGSTPNATVTCTPGVTITDGSTTITSTTTETFSGCTISGTTPNATITCPRGISFTDGSTTVTLATSLSFANGVTISGSTPNAIATPQWATTSDIWASTAHKFIDPAGANLAIAPTTVSPSGATFTINFGAAINSDLTLVHASCPCTIANPTNVYAGLSGNITIHQSATGSDTIGTWGSTWKFSAATAPTLTTTANAIDVLPFYCRTTTFCAVTFIGDVR